MNDRDQLKERVRAAVDLADFIQASGVKLSGGPVEWKGLCPFHKENTPSFTVNSQKAIFKCFGGTCGVTGDVFDFVMRTKGLNFLSALRTVANSVGIAVPEPRVYQDLKAIAANSVQREPLDWTKYRALVPEGKVWKYLTQERKLAAGLLVKYAVGETVDGEAYSFAYRWRPPGMVKSVEKDGYTEFLKVVKVDRVDGKKEEWRAPKGGKNILFGMLAVPEDAQELVITEGEIDAITWAQYGFPAVSVPCGAGALNWLTVCWDWLQRFKKIHLSFDEDRAGRAKVVEIVQRLGMARTDIVRLAERNDIEMPK